MDHGPWTVDHGPWMRREGTMEGTLMCRQAVVKCGQKKMAMRLNAMLLVRMCQSHYSHASHRLAPLVKVVALTCGEDSSQLAISMAIGVVMKCVAAFASGKDG